MCYEPLREPVVFKVEAFNEADCPNDDVWPCPGMLGMPERATDPPIGWGALFNQIVPMAKQVRDLNYRYYISCESFSQFQHGLLTSSPSNNISMVT